MRSTHSLLVRLILPLALAGTASAAYFPTMTYGPVTQVAPGVTLRKANVASPKIEARILTIDMTNRNVELVPVFKANGNVANSANEKTSSMATRSDAVAAINAGYYNVTSGDPGYLMTNSYTKIDGVFIGGSGAALAAENNRSVIGFSGDHHTLARRMKLTSASVPVSSADNADWARMVNVIGGRGSFITSGGTVVTQDNEGTGAGHSDSSRSRTAMGYSANPYRVYMVTVDEGSATSSGVTYTQLARLMADFGIEQSVSLDGGGSTTMWVKGSGVINDPSDAGGERSVASAWCVLSANTMDNTVSEVTKTGTWATDTADANRYNTDQLIGSPTGTVGAATVRWNPNLAESGSYKVYAWWTQGSGRSTAAPYTINHAGGTATVLKSQQSNGRKWNLLGTYAFAAGTGGSVTLANTATGTVSADAVRFVRVGSAVIPTPTPTPTVTPTATPIPTSSPIPTATVTPTVTPIASPTPTPTPVASITLDNTAATYTGTWATGTGTGGWLTNYRYATAGTANTDATYTFNGLTAGTYRVSVYYLAGTNRSASAVHVINRAGGSGTVNVNQQINGGQWFNLGVYTFGTSGSIVVRAAGSGTGVVMADGVRFERVP